MGSTPGFISNRKEGVSLGYQEGRLLVVAGGASGSTVVAEARKGLIYQGWVIGI